ncbi:MAG: iron-containing alcohol dehydrogenase family protein [Clostridiales bacterium]|nr:iron-containing alcohol dehydrogenase family protein [Clostridiales bacterium]
MNKNHINIPSILKIEKGVTGRIGTYLKEADLTEVTILFGNGLIDMFGDTVFKSCEEAGVNILHHQEMDTVDFNDITDLAFQIPNKTKAIVGMGGGKVIDAAKYIGFILQIPFISVPTSSSSDGFSSSSASLTIGGHRRSLPAKLAFGILVDTDVIKSAPVRFLYSGVGDMVAKISSTYDWQHEEDLGYTEVNDFAFMIAKKAVNSFVRTPFESINEELFLKELLDSLAMSGIANEIAGSSAPTSGSEHLISHALDLLLEKPQLHGVQVGIGTYIMCKICDHRYQRIDTVFTKTGFWDFCATLDLKAQDYCDAIDMAPQIKPHRHTYLHEEKYRELAKKLIAEDPKLKAILK